MPPKKKSPKTACVACAICSTEVEDGKDECLHCQSCDQKFHRYCAGVALSEYKTYAPNGNSQFECFHCFKVHKESAVTDLRNCIEVLKAEILELRSTVQVLSSRVEATERAENRKPEPPSWSQIVRRSKKRPLKQRQETADTESLPTRPAGQANSDKRRTQKPSNSQKMVKADGARKIWGTLKTTTCTAVRNTISSVTKVSRSNLQIKRKYKLNRNNPDTVSKWWFVVRGEESVLLELEQEWNSIAVQTAWKLEPVHYYVEHSTPNESTDLPSTMSAPIVPNSTVSSPTDEPIVSEHTPVNSLNTDDTSSAAQSQQHIATDMQPLPPSSQSPCPVECTQSEELDTQGNGHAPLKPVPSGFNSQQGAQKEQQ